MTFRKHKDPAYTILIELLLCGGVFLLFLAMISYNPESK